MAARGDNGLKTWEYPKKSGIRIREIINSTSGYTYEGSYLVTIPAKLTGADVKKRQFKNKAQAEEWAETAYSGSLAEGRDHFSLSSTERREVATNIPILREHGITLTEAVQLAVKRLKPKGGQKTLEDVIYELMASKELRLKKGSLRFHSVKDFRSKSSKINKIFGNEEINMIECSKIKEWLAGMELQPRTIKNHLDVMSEIFIFAKQRKYIALSPLDDLTDVDRKELYDVTGDIKEPSILSIDDAEILIRATVEHPELDLIHHHTGCSPPVPSWP